MIRYRAAAALALLAGLAMAGGCARQTSQVTVPEPIIRAEAQRVGPPLWKVPLKNAVPESMDFVGDDGLLVRLRADEAVEGHQRTIMLDRATGRVRWQFRPDDEDALYDHLLLLRESLLLRVTGKDGSRLVALNLADGKPRWSAPLDSPAVQVLPTLKDGVLVLAQFTAKAVVYAGFDPHSGQRRWRREFAAQGGGGSVTLPPLASLDALWHFEGGVARLDPRTGKDQWRRAEIRPGEDSPPAVLDGNRLLMLDGHSRLQALDARSGKTLWTVSPANDVRFTGISPGASQIYLRGSRKQGKGFVMMALGSGDGRTLWRNEQPAETVSNVIEADGRVFVATPKRLLALDARSGAPAFDKEVTNAGHDFPVHLRRVGHEVVFIGELMVAAYDTRTGKERYADGMDPVSQAASLASIDMEIALYGGHLQGRSPAPAGSGAMEIARAAQTQASQYQASANHYNRIANEKFAEYQRGGGLSADMAYYESAGARAQAQIDSSFSRAQSQIAMQTAAWAAGEQIGQAVSLELGVRRARRNVARRDAVVTLYTEAEDNAYVYRPTAYDHPQRAPFVGVTVIRLDSGQLRQSLLSPRYETYGMWCLVDLANKVAYFQGLGLDPKQYKLGEAQFVEKRLESFLIARRIQLP